MFRASNQLKTLQCVGYARQTITTPATQLLSSPGILVPSHDREQNDSTLYAKNSTATVDPICYQYNGSSLLLFRAYHTRGSFRSQYTGSNIPPKSWIHGIGGSSRGFASSASSSPDNAVNSDSSSSLPASVDDTLERLFQENKAFEGDATAEPWVDGINSVASSGGLDFVPTWYNPADQCINLILKLQEMTGVELGWAIVGTTLLIRVALFPLVVSGQKSSSRMAHLQPEMIHLRQKFERIPNPTTEQKAQLGNQIRDLFQKYDVKPLRAMVAPFMQFPFFMGMFFGLKKMPDYFPEEMHQGGMLWFPDLTMTDPNYILPGVCFLTFLATVELGKEQMMAGNPQNAPMMINLFRGLSVMMIPICINFHAGMLCYWTVSNLFTLVQIWTMKVPAFKNAVGIWDPPKPVPGLHSKDEGFMKAAEKLMHEMQGKPTSAEAKLKQHNEKVENKKKVAELSRSSRERRRRAIKNRRTSN